MISPDTSPGTDVICIDDNAGPFGAGGLRKGMIYTVARIVPAITGGYAVVLAELAPWEGFAPPWGVVEVGFDLKRFRYLNIPKSLTELLTTTPVDLDATK